MKQIRVFPVFLGSLLVLATAAASPGGVRVVSPDSGRDTSSLTSLYEKISPAVVGIECWTSLVDREEAFAAFGTGVIIDPAGLILTSVTVVPDSARLIRVYLRGGKRIDARKVLSIPEKELVLLRPLEKRRDQKPFPFLRLGDSSRLKVGQLSFALGNAFRSIAVDDQVSFAAGAISGSYELTEKRSESSYLGPALETTSAVNDGMDGGPLVDDRGEIIGLLSLNFSRNRWLSTAIPINILKPYLARDLGWFGDRLERFSAYLGIELWPAEIAAPGEGSPGGAFVGRVDRPGPAARAGLAAGDLILSWNGTPVAGVSEFRALFEKARPGTPVKLEIQRKALRRTIEVLLGGRF